MSGLIANPEKIWLVVEPMDCKRPAPPSSEMATLNRTHRLQYPEKK